ncbi:MAG: NirD/YgiW/YdeI family stress tolerance protein [Bacteroidales bacterium]|nr:NirD/YgiW/YdeI family stress tolerance protein [Bacteroidales bacterium]
MKLLKYYLVLIVACQALLNMQAQYTGHGATMELSVVKDVIDNASKLDKSDKQVKVKGFVIEQINNDTFWFKDTTGRIRVEIEKKQMPATPFNEKTEVIILGEVDYDLLEGCEIEADSVIIKQ